jgi:hypothetical protein
MGHVVSSLIGSARRHYRAPGGNSTWLTRQRIATSLRSAVAQHALNNGFFRPAGKVGMRIKFPAICAGTKTLSIPMGYLAGSGRVPTIPTAGRPAPEAGKEKLTVFPCHFASTAHRIFAFQLEMLVDGMGQEDCDPETVANPTACELGKWLAALAAELAHLPPVRELATTHRRFH